MSKKIYRNILFTALVVFASSMMFIFGGFYYYFDKQQSEKLREELEMTVYGVENCGPEYLKQTDFSTCRMTLVAADGTVLYDTAVDPATMDNHGQRAEIVEAMKNGIGSSVRYSSTLMEKTQYYAKKLSDGSVLRISQTEITLGAIVIGMQQPIMLVLVIAFVLSAVLAFRLSENIVKPINQLNLEDPLGNKIYEELTPLLKRIEKQNQELKRAYTLAQQDRIEFTANVSHELKTPLQSIMGSAELIENGMVKAEDMPAFAGRMRSEAARMVTLVEDIIRLSQLDTAEALPLEIVHLMEVAKEVRASLQETANKKHIMLTLKGEDVAVTGVYRLIMEILYNLCDNAIQYNKGDGVVHMEIRENGNKAEIVVKDTGIGIPQEDQTHIFERFYRIDKSRSKRSGGTGLGLSIVKHAVQYHNGEIKLNSKLGEGTEIIVSLPK